MPDTISFDFLHPARVPIDAGPEGLVAVRLLEWARVAGPRGLIHVAQRNPRGAVGSCFAGFGASARGADAAALGRCAVRSRRTVAPNHGAPHRRAAPTDRGNRDATAVAHPCEKSR